MKKPLIAWAILIAAAQFPLFADAKVDFAKQIQPILEKNCIKCHGEEKQKGKLRLDSKAAALKGGEDGEVIAPGKADKSDLVRRITLPKGNDDIMPPKGEPLGKAETDLIRDWINQGAEWPDGIVLKQAKADAVPPAAEKKEPAASGKVDFVKQVEPIFQKTCVECHGPEKQKGKLRLDSRDAVMKRAADDQVVVPGHPEKSELVRRISLPKDDDDFMPKKHDPLATEQIDLIKRWITEGADWPAGATIAAAKKAPEKAKPDHKPTEEETKAIAALEPLGVSVRPIAMNLHWYEANLRMQGSNVIKAALPYLAKITGLVDLNLASTPVTDQDLSQLKELKNLTHLHLEKTAVTDAGLENLKGLTDLTYLNLYGTGVTDAGLKNLTGLSNLAHLYVWQTKVTEAGAKELHAALPNVDINRGWDLASLEKKEEKKEPPKEQAKK